MVLLNLADSWRSPLNNPFDKLYLVLRPVRKKARALLHSIAAGKVRAPQDSCQCVRVCVRACVRERVRGCWRGQTGRCAVVVGAGGIGCGKG